MKLKIKHVFFICLIFCGTALNSCTDKANQIVKPTSFPVSATFTPVPATSTLTITKTVIPTSTRISTPTSNFQNIPQVLFTPASPSICPRNNSSEIDIPTELPLDESTIMTILNSGGVERLVRFLSQGNDVNFRYEDLTNDNVRELIIRNWSNNYVAVFGCQNGKYVKLLIVPKAFELTPRIIAVQDLNRNGVKELVVDMMT